MTPDELRSWRTRLNLTRKAAAHTLGLHERTYRNYELGNNPIPRYIALAAAAVAFGLPPMGEDDRAHRGG